MGGIIQWIANVGNIIIDFFQKLMVTISPDISIWVNPSLLFLTGIISIIVGLIYIYYKKNKTDFGFVYSKQKITQIIFGIVIILLFNFLIYNTLDNLKSGQLSFLNIKGILLNSNYNLSDTNDIKSLQLDIQDKMQQTMMGVVDLKTPLLFKDIEQYKDGRNKYLYYKLNLKKDISLKLDTNKVPIELIYYNGSSLQNLDMTVLFSKENILSNYLKQEQDKNGIINYKDSYSIQKDSSVINFSGDFTVNHTLFNNSILWSIKNQTLKNIITLGLTASGYSPEKGDVPPFIIKIDKNIIIHPFMVYIILNNPNVATNLMEEYDIDNLSFLNLRFNHNINGKIYDGVDNGTFVANNYKGIALNPFFGEIIDNYSKAFGTDIINNSNIKSKIKKSIDANSLNLIQFIVIFIVLIIIFVVGLIVLNMSGLDNLAKIFGIVGILLLGFFIASKFVVGIMSLFLYIFIFNFNIFFINKIIDDEEE